MDILNETALAAAEKDAEKADRIPIALSEKAFRIIREQILNGEILPGEKLKIEVLQRKYALSSSPLREALNRLVAERLVIADDRRGFRAVPISAGDLNDIVRCRLMIEP